MDTQPKPNVEINISAKLRDLFHGKTTEGVAIAAESCAVPADEDMPIQLAEGVWSEIALRCDGQRPICFAGKPLFSLADTTSVYGSIAIDLYLAVDGSVYAHCVISPKEDVAASRITRGALIKDAPALNKFLKKCAPLSSVHADPSKDPQLARNNLEAVHNLQRSFCTLIAQLPQRSVNQK